MRGKEWGLCAQESLKGIFFSFKSNSWQNHLECVSPVGGTASPVGGTRKETVPVIQNSQPPCRWLKSTVSGMGH